MKALSKATRVLGPIALATALAAPGAASAAVVNLNAVADSTIFDNGNVNNGQGLFAGQNGAGQVQRTLIRFDTSSLAGATINSVTLTMHVNAQGYGSTGATLSIHELNQAWNEATIGGGGPTSGGGGGSAPNPGDATWTDSGASGAWTAGGNFDPTASDSVALGGLGFFNFSSGALTADVQSWASGSANNGWIIIGNEATLGGSVRMSSSTNGGGGGTWVPVLTVDYTAAVVPVPAAVWLFGSGLLGLVGVARRRRG